MAEKPQITLGPKSSSLTPSTLFSISHNLTLLSSATPTTTATTTSTTTAYQLPLPQTLTPPEYRATLTLLLLKLPHLTPLSQILNSVDLTLTPFHVSNEERKILEDSLVGSVLDGVGGLLDYGGTTLSPLGEAVAALSCEASNAVITGFNSVVDSGDGKCVKDYAAVAGDLRVLLNGSRLVGKVEVDGVERITEDYAGLREAVRGVHSKARVALNCGGVGSGGGGVGKGWVKVLPNLAAGLRDVAKGGLSRVGANVGAVGNERLRQLVEENCPSKESLREAVKRVSEAEVEEEYVEYVHNVYMLFGLVRSVIVWEMITAVVALGGSELLLGVQGGGANGEDGKVDKKKKKKVMGKGTTAIMEVIKDKVKGSLGEGVDEFAALRKLVEEIQLLVDPKGPAFGDFLEKVKEIVESNETRRLPKIAKGTRDFAKEQMTVRERAFSIIKNVFKRHGATELDTPVFELRETLMGKYGEDSKLIFDLADQGGELCSLRYDLTVPFARYMAMNSLTSFKRYQIGKVYRRDNPSKGRYREFYQCDLDIAGQYEKMRPDSEVVKILTELLDELNIGDYEVKLNHRKLLDGMLDICGVPPEKFRTICSSIDKLDKLSFDQVKREMVEEKGLNAETADKIGSFVKNRGSPLEVLAKLKQDGSEFLKHEGSSLALGELEILFKALEKTKCIDKIVFDLSLARGLDYYTGVIYEAVFKGTTQVGSIAAGGRYDNLIGMFGSKQVPAVGVSLGIERVFAIMEQNQKDKNQVIRANETQVLVGVMAMEDDWILAEELANELWSGRINTEFTSFKKVVKFFEVAEASGIPFAVIVGERELKAGIVKVRDVQAKKEESVPRERMVEELQNRLRNLP